MPRHATEPYVQKHAANWQPMTTIFDMAVAVPAAADAVIIDEEINVAVFGLCATTYRHANVTFMIEKPDGLGGWVATSYSGTSEPGFYDYGTGTTYNIPGVPTDDPEGYETIFGIIPSPMKLPKHPAPLTPVLSGWTLSRGQETGQDWNTEKGGLGGLRFDVQPEDRISRVRLMVRRSPRVYDAGEQATIDALGYRVRVVVGVPNLVLWEKEVAIPVGGIGATFLDEEVLLPDYGLISDHDRFRFVAEVRRNGKTIRRYLPDEYVVGESFDVPCQNVAVVFRPTVLGTPWWNFQNTSEGGHQLNSGWIYSGSLGQCSESVRQRLRVMAWRWGTDPTTYYDGTLAETVYNLSDLDAAMGASTLYGRTGYAPQPFWGPASMPAIIKFTPTTTQRWNGTIYADTYADATATGIQIFFKSGTSTLADVFAAIDAVNDGNTGLRESTCMVRTGTLSTPAYVFNQSAEFTAQIDMSPASPVAVPAGSFDNCTLVVRLLEVPLNRMWEYPFVAIENGNDSGLAQVMLRTIQGPNIRFPLGTGNGAVGLWNFSGKLVFGLDRVPTWADLKDAPELMLMAPPQAANNYAVHYNGDGTINYEEWHDTTWPTPQLMRRVDFTYASGLVDTEVVKVYSTTTGAIIAQATITYSYSGGLMQSYSFVRDV